VRRHTRIAQRLDEVAAISLMDYPVTDVPGPHSSLRALEAHLLEHDRHMSVLAVSPECLARWLRLLPVLTGGCEPGGRLITAGVAALSPLTLTQDNGELLRMACAHGFPVVPTICPMAGTTSPYSKAGTLLQANAEAVSMAALTQLERPGHPFLYIIGPSRTDMRSGADLYYTLDKVLWKIAGVQLGAAYGLPSGAECGGTAVCRYDLQSGAEGMLFMLAAWQSGAHLLSGIGSCGNAVSMSGEMMVAQTAWLRAAQFLDAGIDMEGYPGLESLEQVGPGGQFLDDGLTLERLRSGEFFADPLFDYDGGHLGTEPLLERAHRRAVELAAGEDSPVPGEVREGIRRFFREECCRG
jgi:trimethylamine--corrinoid protein Co-methyltransferase